MPPDHGPGPVGHGPGCAGGHCYYTHAFDLIEGEQNWAYMYPDAGFTTYPGLPGSGICTHSDYSHVYWLIPPRFNAKQVIDRLDILGVPLVPPEPEFLGKNPHVTDGVKLPVPRGWFREKDPEPEKGKEPKEAEKGKGIDQEGK
jgi:hypothetical protein